MALALRVQGGAAPSPDDDDDDGEEESDLRHRNSARKAGAGEWSAGCASRGIVTNPLCDS
jgi:hypothetical protein